MKKIILISIALLFVSSSGYSQYDNDQLHYRCGNLFVEKGVHSFQVLEECGDPTFVEVYETGYGYGNDDDGYGDRGDSFYIEKWIYGPEAGFYYILYFKLGVLIRLDAARVIY